MSDLLKVVIAVGGALIFGLVVGLLIGYSGKGKLETQVQAAGKRASTAEEALKEDRADCKRRVDKAQLGRQLLLAKEALLRSLVEVHGLNYGLASRHLGNARARLAAARKRAAKSHKDRLKKLHEQVTNVQTVVLRTDPMARKFIQDMLAELQSIPGAR